jgi:hypothetical protein
VGGHAGCVVSPADEYSRGVSGCGLLCAETIAAQQKKLTATKATCSFIRIGASNLFDSPKVVKTCLYEMEEPEANELADI